MYQQVLDEVRSDHLSGASELAGKAARVLHLFCQEWNGNDLGKFKEAFVQICKDLAKYQREITPIFNLVNQCLNILHSQESKKDLNQLKSSLSARCQSFQKESGQALKKIWEQGGEMLPSQGVYLTFSSSSSVLGILRKAHQKGKKVEVFVSESRPLLEGRRLARILAEEGIKVNLVIDSACGYFMPKVDLVLCGADSLTETNLVNKVGSYALILLARHHNKPIWLAAEESKFVPGEVRGIPAISGDPKEIWQESPSGIVKLNPYFEMVPLNLVNQIITGQGILAPSEVANFIHQQPVAKELLEL